MTLMRHSFLGSVLRDVKKLSLSKMICLVCLFCAATAIASPAQSFATFYSFCSLQNCTDGSGPAAAVTQGTDGNFYGTTSFGGTNGLGSGALVYPQCCGRLIALRGRC